MVGCVSVDIDTSAEDRCVLAGALKNWFVLLATVPKGQAVSAWRLVDAWVPGPYTAAVCVRHNACVGSCDRDTCCMTRPGCVVMSRYWRVTWRHRLLNFL